MKNYEVFKDNIFKLTKIDLSAYKEKQMKRRILSLIARNGYNDFEDYFNALKQDNILYEEFLNYLTINVSEFYRNPKQWEVLESRVIPKLKEKNNKIKVWSSACSTGDEPYSLVMLLNKFFRLSEIEVLATDIDQSAINKAQVGLYDEKGLKNLPLELKNKYFEKVGNKYKISNKIKDCVSFKRMDLLKDPFPQENHLILCRNVLIYFTEEAKTGIYHKFHDALTMEGILFVGSTEQIIFPSKYALESLETFFYKKVK